jgi:hypothetical protein
LPIVRSRVCSEAFEVCYSACGINIDREVNDNLVLDNRESIKSGNVSDRGIPLYNFSKEVIEDIKVRTLVVMERD